MSAKLHMETGHAVTADVQIVAGERLRFVNADQRTIFEVVANEASISVRGVEFHFIGDAIHGGGIIVAPRASNEVEISTPFYGMRQKGGQA
jgi:hypothetical protein